MTTDPKELMPCPLCGGDANYSSQTNRKGLHEFVICSKCYLHFGGSIKEWNTRADLAPTDGDAERALEALDALTVFHGTLYYKQLGQWVIDYISTIRAALQSTRKPSVPCSMAVDLTEWLYELFCESQSIDMHDIQTKMLDLGIIEGIEATAEDIDNGFDTNDIVFHKTEAYKKQGKPPVPVDTIAVPREVLQGVREALEYCVEYLHNPFEPDNQCRAHVNGRKALASLDAVLNGAK